MKKRCLAVIALAVLAFMPAAVEAQTAPEPEAKNPATQAPERQTNPSKQSKWWIVGGGGFAMVRAGCATCSRTGVFTNSKGFFLDMGGRVNPRVDAGVEMTFVRGRVAGDDPILTTFIMGLAQFRPSMQRGLYLRAGMGVGFAGHGISSPFGPALAPPYSTNAMGVSYGIGWIFRRERRVTVQAAFSQHVAALGQVTLAGGETLKNVVGNYWTSGLAIVIR